MRYQSLQQAASLFLFAYVMLKAWDVEIKGIPETTIINFLSQHYCCPRLFFLLLLLQIITECTEKFYPHLHQVEVSKFSTLTSLDLVKYFTLQLFGHYYLKKTPGTNSLCTT